MVTETEIRPAVDEAFRATRRGLEIWPDPHGNVSPVEAEYSQLTDPGRWRIVNARAEAWSIALVELGLGEVEEPEEIRWSEVPPAQVTGGGRVTPNAPGALPLVLARNRLGGVVGAGVTVGVGDPTSWIALWPTCGCHACDGGAQYELYELDALISSVVVGTFRFLTAKRGRIVVVGAGDWTAEGLRRSDDVERILRNPAGWKEISGASWLPTG